MESRRSASEARVRRVGEHALRLSSDDAVTELGVVAGRRTVVRASATAFVEAPVRHQSSVVERLGAVGFAGEGRRIEGRAPNANLVELALKQIGHAVEGADPVSYT